MDVDLDNTEEKQAYISGFHVSVTCDLSDPQTEIPTLSAQFNYFLLGNREQRAECRGSSGFTSYVCFLQQLSWDDIIEVSESMFLL